MIIAAIDKYLEQRPADERATYCFHPSTLHKSADYLYKAYFEGDSDNSFPPRVLRIFDVGHSTHRRLQRYLKEIGILKEDEVPIFNEDYEIRGHSDGIIEIGNKKGVLEIKSMNATTFYGCHQPKAEHLIQINIYMFCSCIPRGVLLYECKDNQELKEFYVKQDPAILDPILEKIKRVQRMIRE